MKKTLLMFMFLSSVTGASAESSDIFDSYQGGIRVEIMIYSGRENPHWLISNTNDTAQMINKLKNTPEAYSIQPWSLGFTGFNLTPLITCDVPCAIQVFLGHIIVKNGNILSYYKDVNGIEAELIAMSNKQSLSVEVSKAINSYEIALNMVNSGLDFTKIINSDEATIINTLQIGRVLVNSDSLLLARKLLESEKSERISVAALAIIGQFGSAEDKEILQKFTTNPSPYIKANAERALKRLISRSTK